MNVKKRERPDFIIVGAAKSGTTSLFEALSGHPDIFTPDNKEPWFYSHRNINLSDIVLGPQKDKIIQNDENYLKIYEDAKDSQICGEASTAYLYDYDKTIDNISELVRDWREIKIIIILRNPIYRAFSHYMNNARAGYDKRTFREAINSCVNKRATRYRNYLAYGLYSQQVMSYTNNFHHVKVIIFEDLIKNSHQIISETFKFLGCSIDGKDIFELKKENFSGESKYPWITSLIYRPNLVKKLVTYLIPKKARKTISDSIKSMVLEKKSITEEDKDYLKQYYKDDIIKLQNILGCELDEWN